ncbi:class II aldolase/adducin family protein [Phaeobacter sp. QD34_3]|uniref:class II aldolase/adducin family protein n=1 Tax=unclassified Phaeobacter TaxID=2621772 RepID=UPI00237FA93A|nr:MULTISPECIES: class II aldolase/adducin family protein [unclassified Phaeobacter]MDE4132160.1 class II aldolase/adducin family protein [Phaeobacter sp. QD34_3]MDE4135798.1 class II aldolase/adducin family protein [Phaeobacter sp. QD34_24]MDE4172587.1 class II aldolase/adducin family protein [Phaeobacter sp. PT47_59]
MTKPPYADRPALRQAIIDACLSMERQQINQGTSGNISVRVGDAMLITPSGVDYAKMTPQMIVSMPLDGSAPEAGQMRPSSEWRFHRDILRSKPKVNAVVHAHPVHCTALAMNRTEIPACHYMVAAFGGDTVPVAEYALFGTSELSDTVLESLHNRAACLMANHGAVVIGDTLERALWRMVELETLAKGYITSLSIGQPHILTDADMAEVKAAFADYGLRDV